MVMPVKHIELPEVLPFRLWFHNPLFPLFRERQWIVHMQDLLVLLHFRMPLVSHRIKTR